MILYNSATVDEEATCVHSAQCTQYTVHSARRRTVDEAVSYVKNATQLSYISYINIYIISNDICMI